MPVKEPLDELRAEMAKLRRVEDGKLARKLRAALATVAVKMAQKSFELRMGPDMKPWKPGKDGSAGNLSRSGRLRSGIEAQSTDRGFVLVDRAQTDKGKFYAGTQQYGRTIRSSGMQRRYRKGSSIKDKEIGAGYRIDTTTGLLMRPRGGRLTRVGAGYKKVKGAMPLKWKTPDGRWHSAWKVRIPARPFFPRGASMPEPWRRAFEAAADELVQRNFK